MSILFEIATVGLTIGKRRFNARIGRALPRRRTPARAMPGDDTRAAAMLVPVVVVALRIAATNLSLRAASPF